MATITSQVLARSRELAEEFRDAVPFRHVVIDDFFDPELCRRLLCDFPNFEERYALNEMNEVGGKAVRMDVRDISDTYRGLDQYLQTPEFLDFVSTLTGIPDLLYDPEYVGGGTHENQDGQGLDQHVDFNFHPGTRWHRRLNLIVYLNPEWEDTWGGNLQLQADPWKAETHGPSIAPLFNRAVVFETTERSWHGFSTIRLPKDKKTISRKSFAIYLYTKQRPQEETAVSHATVYVPDGMPTDLKSGAVLGETQFADLYQRFERVFGQLKFLYDREKQFAAQIANLESALAQARDALRLPIQGYATQPQAPRGMWPDGWVGREFVATLVPTKMMRGIQIELWVSDGLNDDQVLAFELDGKGWTHRVARGSRSRVVLPAKLPAGRELQLKLSAERCFIPANVEQSSDSRELAWKLLSVAIEH